MRNHRVVVFCVYCCIASGPGISVVPFSFIIFEETKTTNVNLNKLEHFEILNYQLNWYDKLYLSCI